MLEIKISKIRTDIDEKLQEEARTDKVHANNESEKISVDDKQDKLHSQNEYDEDKNRRNKAKRFCTVNGFKYRKGSLEITAQKEKIIDEEEQKGNVLDVKK